MNDDLTDFLASRVEATALAAADKASLRWATVTKTAPEVTIILDGQQGELRGVDCVGTPQAGQRVPVLLAGRQALVIAGGGGPQAPTAPPVPVGTIFDYAGTNAPAGYLFVTAPPIPPCNTRNSPPPWAASMFSGTCSGCRICGAASLSCLMGRTNSQQSAMWAAKSATKSLSPNCPRTATLGTTAAGTTGKNATRVANLLSRSIKTAARGSAPWRTTG